MSSSVAAPPQIPSSTSQSPTVVHKFGGTSVADAERYRHVAQLLLARGEHQQITVVSAMKGVTDALIALAELASGNLAEWRDRWHELRARHRGAAVALLAEDAGPTLEWMDARFDELAEILGALAVIGELPREVLDRVQGLGEVFSAHLLGRIPDRARTKTARCWMRARCWWWIAATVGVDVDWLQSAQRLSDWRAGHPQRRLVVTGFVARDRSGRITTLGRNGSDYSGAIFAALFNADELHIWTDVDGVLSADPRVVPEAVQLSTLSYDEACELAYFGAKVVHPQTMSPAIERGLPIVIRNTFHPEHPGTRITAVSDAHGPVKGLTLSPDLAVLNLEGTGLIGVPGTAERVFAALRDARVSVVMISQGSSEHSICCVVRSAEAQRAQNALLNAFAHELTIGQVQRVQRTDGVSVLAAVGDGMAGQPGVAARLFEALGRARVNILAIAQGSSERNISVAIDSADATKALRAAHAGFWLSPQTFSVGVIGPGNVGATLIEQLRAAQPQLLGKANLDLRLRAIASSRKMLLDERGIGADWRERFDAGTQPADLDRFTAHLLSAHLPHAVIVDCSASPEVAERYADWLAAGIHVVTPNKQAGAGPLSRYEAIREATAASGARFRYEATVGAGLPVISTLRDLLDTGDAVVSVEGIFSGTLAWLFNKYDGSVPFSQLVTEARALGYTEPDPRDDLSGTQCRPQAGDPGARGRTLAGAGGRGDREPGAGSAAQCQRGRFHGAAVGGGRRVRRAPGRSEGRRPGAALCRPAGRRGPGAGRAGRAAGGACVRQPAPDRQHRAVHHPALLRQSAHRARAGRRSGSDRGRRVRRSAAGGGRTGSQAVKEEQVGTTAMTDTASAFAPASVGNVGVGFDILGHVIEGAGDTVHVRRIAAPEVRIADIRGATVDLPRDAPGNTAGAALISLLEAERPGFGFEIEIEKGIPLGSGMGGSAASCVAALVAANALLPRPLSREALYPHALVGEAVASGGRHGDNLGPMLLGGLVLSTADRLVQIPVPEAWHCVLVHPDAVLETPARPRRAGRRLRTEGLRCPERTSGAAAGRMPARRRGAGARRTE